MVKYSADEYELPVNGFDDNDVDDEDDNGDDFDNSP